LDTNHWSSVTSMLVTDVGDQMCHQHHCHLGVPHNRLPVKILRFWRNLITKNLNWTHWRYLIAFLLMNMKGFCNAKSALEIELQLSNTTYTQIFMYIFTFIHHKLWFSCLLEWTLILTMKQWNQSISSTAQISEN